MKTTALARMNLFMQMYNARGTITDFSDNQLVLDIDKGDFGDSPVVGLTMKQDGRWRAVSNGKGSLRTIKEWSIKLELDDGTFVELDEYMKHHTYQSRTNYMYS